MSVICQFERFLEVRAEGFEGLRRGFEASAWADFLLNPRRLRGSDFLMRWSQGVWSESRIVEAIAATGRYRAIPYGPSGVAPSDDPRSHELYFERLEAANLQGFKRPDLLVIRESDARAAADFIEGLGGEPELPFVSEKTLNPLLRLSILALECENSLWRASKMPSYGKELRIQRRTGKPGLPKSAVLPTIIIKQEDRNRLREWQAEAGVPVHIWHAFFDLAFGIRFDDAERLIEAGSIEPTQQVFQAPGGATTRKTIFKIYYQHAYRVGAARSEPRLTPDFVEDRNGHILPYVRFEGGALQLADDAVAVLDDLACH